MTIKYWWVQEFTGGKKSKFFDTEDQARQDMWKALEQLPATKELKGKTVALIKGCFTNGKLSKIEKIKVVILTWED